MTKFIKRLLLVAILAGLCNACASNSTQSSIADGYVTRDEQLRQLLSDRTFYGQYSDGARWTEYYKKNGDSAYEQDGKVCRGQWRILDGTACFTYADYLNGDPNCFKIRKAGMTVVFEPDTGEADVTADKSIAGDPEGLESKVSESCHFP